MEGTGCWLWAHSWGSSGPGCAGMSTSAWDGSHSMLRLVSDPLGLEVFFHMAMNTWPGQSWSQLDVPRAQGHSCPWYR